MFDLETIRAVNKRAAVFKRRRLAEAMNCPGGHAKDAEKGRKCAKMAQSAKIAGRDESSVSRPINSGLQTVWDDPEWDGTDFAHPAWWRGLDSGCLKTAMRMERAADGKDEGAGVLGCPVLERVRRKIIALTKQAG